MKGHPTYGSQRQKRRRHRLFDWYAASTSGSIFRRCLRFSTETNISTETNKNGASVMRSDSNLAKKTFNKATPPGAVLRGLFCRSDTVLKTVEKRFFAPEKRFLGSRPHYREAISRNPTMTKPGCV
jgi:hypothetical protein